MLFKSNCCHIYSIVLLLHYLTLVWFISHELFLKLLYALIKHKNFSKYIFCLVQLSLQSYWPFATKLSNSYLTNHDPLPKSSYHNISLQTKSLNKPISIVWFVWLCCMDCLWYAISCAIVFAKSYVPSWEKWKDRDLQKGKWHPCPSPILLMH
jgi:hypothetical protein